MGGVVEVQVGAAVPAVARWLPCGLTVPGGKAAAPANCQRYFDTYDHGSETDLKASFRGRELNGQKFTFPDNYEAYVLNETRQPLFEEANRIFHVNSKFKEMTYWNWNKKTSKNDSFQRAMEWIDIANVLHEPVNATNADEK